MTTGRTTHLLLLRFSALGDVLMTVPVIDALAREYPYVKITVVSRPFVGSVFCLLPSNVTFVGINPRNYKGLAGLWRLYGELKALGPTHIADLHDVLRTKVIRKFFALSGYPVRHIVKNRKARRDFIRSTIKVQQTTGFERYAQVLARLGFPVTLDVAKPFSLVRARHEDGDALRVGIAPFAAHKGKVYPLGKMEEVVRLLSQGGCHTFLFGAGDYEKKIMTAWAQKYNNTECVVGTLPDMAAELQLMARLDVILTMDSGNMHLAALCSTPVVSIWGATHPLGGFMGWGCKRENVLEFPGMECRPCSIYGSKPCKWGDYRCLQQITPQQVVEKLKTACNKAR